MTEFELGWVIGLIEGEGAFVASQDKRRPTTYSVKIQVEMTDKDMIYRLNELVPGRVWESNYPSRAKRFPNAKPSWRWAISDKQRVKQLIEITYPYMSIRRKEQMDKLLPHCEYKRKKNQ